MARLMCSCGTGLNNSNVPSDCILYIFSKKDVDNAITVDSDITLYDFETGLDEKMEYWYCRNCKRVLAVESIPGGKVKGSYVESLSSDERGLTNLSAFYVFNDTEIYNAEEENYKVLLSDFILQQGEQHLYFADADRCMIYRLIQGDQYELVYKKE